MGRLSRGESICDTEVVNDVSCVDDVVEQLYHRLADESGKLTLTQIQLLIDQLPDAHYRVVRQTEVQDDDDDDDDVNHHGNENDHDHDHNAVINVRVKLVWLYCSTAASPVISDYITVILRVNLVSFSV